MTATDPVVFLSYARTPMGGMQGVLSDASATDLGATAVKAAVERAGVKGDDIERIYMGCVLPAGLGQAPARQAAIKAGLPQSVQATTANKACGSGLQTVLMGPEALAPGSLPLGATAVKAAVERAGGKGDDIERIYMGCVLPAGRGQAPARQAAIKAGLPKSVQATTVNKVCGSGMQTVIMGAEALAAGSIDLVVAGGMESMTNAPYLLKKHRGGARIGHDTAYDHMFLDGLEDAYEAGRAMGTFAQDTADAYQLSRQAQDDYSIESLKRAQAAIASGAFAGEIAPVTLTTRKGEVVVDTDEQPGKGNPDKIPTLRPAFAKDGTITAATSSSISDGAAAVVLTRQSVAEAKAAKPVAELVAHAAPAQAPKDFPVDPIGPTTTFLAQAGGSTG